MFGHCFGSQNKSGGSGRALGAVAGDSGEGVIEAEAVGVALLALRPQRRSQLLKAAALLLRRCPLWLLCRPGAPVPEGRTPAPFLQSIIQCRVVCHRTTVIRAFGPDAHFVNQNHAASAQVMHKKAYTTTSMV